METFVDKLRRDYPSIVFVQGATAHWSAQTQKVTYTLSEPPSAVWTLLHELGHALLGHTSYDSDAGLLQKEVEAWENANRIAKKYGVVIDNDHVQQCLDTYREWLHKRSTCPTCASHGIQQSEGLYTCLNCQDAWKVTHERFCRPYRLKKGLIAKYDPS